MVLKMKILKRTLTQRHDKIKNKQTYYYELSNGYGGRGY